MKITLQLTLDAMTGTLRRLAHRAVEEADRKHRTDRRANRQRDNDPPRQEGRDDEPRRP